MGKSGGTNPQSGHRKFAQLNLECLKIVVQNYSRE